MPDSVAPNIEDPPAGHLKQAWLVLLLALLYGGGLAGVQSALSGRIAANQLNETLDQIPQLIDAAASGLDRSDELPREIPERLFQALDSYGQPCGWVVKTGGQGFADRIEVLVGLNPDATRITDIYVLSQKETPGLGDYIASIDFTDRLQDMPADSSLQAVRRDPAAPGEFRAWTGATVSSVAVAEIINQGLARVKPLIAELPPSAPEGAAE